MSDSQKKKKQINEIWENTNERINFKVKIPIQIYWRKKDKCALSNKQNTYGLNRKTCPKKTLVLKNAKY